MPAYRRFTRTDRLNLESLYNIRIPVKHIAAELQFSMASVYRELKRGFYQHLNTDYTTTRKYSADLAQQNADYQATSKGVPLKIGNDFAFLRCVEDLILTRKYSPDAALAHIRRERLPFKTAICTTTLYHYIDMGLFPHLTNKDLMFKGTRRRVYRKVHPVKKPPRGVSIEKRPDFIGFRAEFGHWEMDSVIGKREKGQTLLVLTERLTRQQLIFRTTGKTAQDTVHFLNSLEYSCGKYFSRIFRTITVDNGTEFSDCHGMERSAYRDAKRTSLYYCHPFCSGERCSNEKQNQLIRRFIRKGTRIELYSDNEIRAIQDWLNHYPRRMFGYFTSMELFDSELSKLGIPKNILKNIRVSY